MSRINNRSFARIAVSFSAAAFVALGTALPSFAADGTSLNVLAGTLGVSGTSTGEPVSFSGQLVPGTGVGAFADLHLNGSAQTPTTSFSLADIVDSRGTGVGWRISMAMTRFTNGTTTLPTGSLTVRNTSVVSPLDSSSTPVGGFITSPGLQPGVPLDMITDVMLVTSAGTGGGMGSYNVSPADLALYLPANLPLGNYASVATITVGILP